jgi:hypothetical protein
MALKFVKRLSDAPDYDSPGGNRCPEVWELASGDFAVIGQDITAQAKNSLPKEVIVGSEEKIVLLPRKVLQSSKANIP